MLLLLFESGNREDVNGNGLASHRQCRVYPALGWAGGESAPHWGGHWECGSDWGGQAGFWLGLGGASTNACGPHWVGHPIRGRCVPDWVGQAGVPLWVGQAADAPLWVGQSGHSSLHIFIHTCLHTLLHVWLPTDICIHIHLHTCPPIFETMTSGGAGPKR